ncbi:MAG: amidohydrolase, partial [Bacteroidetes bacterium]|nr:amidohydrolase [Bacteroidota bacterium]
MKKQLIVLLLLLIGASAKAQIDQRIFKDIELIESQVIDWRHYFHENPELSNREFNTADKIAAHLKSLGMEVQTGVAKTGVVGLLKGNT